MFSLAYGSVAEELKSKGELKRKTATNKARDGHRQDVIGKDAVKISEEGVTFRSYRDGKSFLLTPETTVQEQKKVRPIHRLKIIQERSFKYCLILYPSLLEPSILYIC